MHSFKDLFKHQAHSHTLLTLLMLIFIFNFGWASDSYQPRDSYQQGMDLFHNKQYEEAIFVFKQAELSEKKQLNSLVGQLCCNVALGRMDQIDPTIHLIRKTMYAAASCIDSSNQEPLKPEQQQAAYMCRRRVREVANQMRQTVEQLVRDTVPGIFAKIQMLRQLYPLIDSLEQIGVECCEHNPNGNCCINPLLEQLESWSSFGLSTK